MNFALSINGVDIREYKFPPNTTLFSAPQKYDATEAAIAYGIGYPAYLDLPGTRVYVDPNRGGVSKCDVLAWYRMKNLLEAVKNDLANHQSKR